MLYLILYKPFGSIFFQIKRKSEFVMDAFERQQEDWKRFKEYHPELLDSVVDDFSMPEPIINSEKWGTYKNYQLVGCGDVTSPLCQKYRETWACLDVDAHKGKMWKGEDSTNNGFFRKIHYSCKKPSCCLCYEDWALKQAHMIDDRIKVASKRWGLCEHFVLSFPMKYYYLSEEELLKLAQEALLRRGIVGGCVIKHAFRYDEFKGEWYFSYHLHVLGFLLGGYGRCRHCKKRICEGRNKEYMLCDGFNAVTRRCYEKDGIIVKIAVDKLGREGERNSVYYTAKYQLSHASIRTDKKRPHAYVWFGICSYKKLKVTREKRKALCPICGGELHRVLRCGCAGLNDYDSQSYITDKDSPVYRREYLEPVFFEGRCLWAEVPNSYWRRSGSYEEE